MKLVKRLLKWTTRGLLVVFLLLIGWGLIAYCVFDQGHARGKTVVTIE